MLQAGVCVQHPAEADLSKLPHPDYVWGFKSLSNRSKVTLSKGKEASMRWLPLNVEVFNIQYFTTMSLTAVLNAQTKIWS
jgi:hypothetical protein